MKLTGGYPFWLIKDGLIHNYPKLINNIETHTVIIGGGISGALTAYHLINAGIDCVLVDGRTIGLGSTCASTSLLQYELDEPLHLLKKKVGEKRAERAYKLCEKALDELKKIMVEICFTDYQQTGSLYFSKHASEKKFYEE
jgi:glycine/D-amino acid oxidase-like deaminating enzyme